MATTRMSRASAARTGAPVRKGPRWRIVRLACGHPRKDRMARVNEWVWCDTCGDFSRVVSVWD